MGNIVEMIAAHKLEALLVAAIVSAGYLIYNQHQEQQKLKEILLRSIKSKDTGIKEFQNALNQVYLKEHVEHSSLRNQNEHPIYKIAITGGPCAGKSTSLKTIHDDLTKKGFRVLMVPEVPTLVVQSGGMILMSQFNIQERIKFQSLLIRFQMYAEDYFTRLAQMSQSPAVVLCDRGTVDPAAYVSKEEFQAIMDEEGWSWVTIRDRRYDRVVFLSSAANGAEQFYTLENNVARHEGLDVARSLDKKTLEAWTGHPHMTICPNIEGETFEQKIQRAVSAVDKTVGLVLKNNRNEKYLIDTPQFPADLKVETSEIEQIFLVNNDEQWSEDKIKKRGQNNSYTYQRKYRSKADKEGDYPQQIRKPLSSLQYVMLREERADAKYKVINRIRHVFVDKDLPYSVDVYNNILGKEKVHILRFNNPEGKDPMTLIPHFLKLDKDVRSDPQYSLRSIAKVE